MRGGRSLFEAVNLTLHTGECAEVRGANGSGKSTLLRATAGLFSGYRGAIKAAPCAYLGHKSAVAAVLSPLENLHFHAQLGSGSAAEALQRVGLGGMLDVRCAWLSEGQRRRVALARLLLGKQRLWLLDEPLTALDDEGRTLVRQLVTEHCSGGGGVLCATHQELVGSAKRLRLGG